MRHKIGQIYKLVENGNLLNVGAISITEKNPRKVGLIGLPFHFKNHSWDEIEETGLWSDTVLWEQAEKIDSPEWNTISDEQFKTIIGKYFNYEDFIPIEFEEYVKILNS